jgi:hypothetical protein
VKANWAMMAIAMGMRQLYLPAKLRIRQWGHLPAQRGPTILIANHHHIDEGETVFSRTFLRHPWKPLITVNSRRAFETGFLAARLPWTAPFTRTCNPGGLFMRLGIFPIENHLFSRPLASFAEDIRCKHGDLLLERVLPEAMLTELGLGGRRLGELWSRELFAKGQVPVKLARLREPHRREAVDHLRARAASDLAAIVERVREGATFYVTPEGDHSRDGRMHPLRSGFLDALLPIAEPWLCAIAYDPFRGRRLSMLYRILRPTDPRNLAASLASARPVTTSALLATFLDARAERFHEDEALWSVRALLDGLPAKVFVDPELRRAPDAATAQALVRLEQRGTIVRNRARYRLTDRRADPRFPHIPDMIAFQRTMLAETLAAARRLEAVN